LVIVELLWSKSGDRGRDENGTYSTPNTRKGRGAQEGSGAKGGAVDVGRAPIREGGVKRGEIKASRWRGGEKGGLEGGGVGERGVLEGGGRGCDKGRKECKENDEKGGGVEGWKHQDRVEEGARGGGEKVDRSRQKEARWGEGGVREEMGGRGGRRWGEGGGGLDGGGDR